MSGHGRIDISKDRLRFDDLTPGIAAPAFMLGGAGILLSLVLGFFAPESLFRGFVVNFGFFLSITLGSLFFVILQHLTRAGWSVVVRRLAENNTTAFPVLAGLSLFILIPLVIGWPGAIQTVYPWSAAPDAHHDLLAVKRPYLNVPFFFIRFVVYFGLWILISRYFRGASIAQDRSGDPQITATLQTRSAPSMLIFALTLTFASIDLLMSLNPAWFSTIFGVYYFAGSALACFATLAVTMNLLQNAGRITQVVTNEHYHDVGKLVFAFVVFWAYIGFSQFMLIWYANLPEETEWYNVRMQGGWGWLSLFLLFGHFVLPFLFLISRHPKRRRSTLLFAAQWVLVMHWLDMFWLVMPRVGSESAEARAVYAASMSYWDVILSFTWLLGIGGMCVWAVASRMGQASLIPERDPRLPESLAFENA